MSEVTSNPTEDTSQDLQIINDEIQQLIDQLAEQDSDSVTWYSVFNKGMYHIAKTENSYTIDINGEIVYNSADGLPEKYIGTKWLFELLTVYNKFNKS